MGPALGRFDFKFLEVEPCRIQPAQNPPSPSLNPSLVPAVAENKIAQVPAGESANQNRLM